MPYNTGVANLSRTWCSTWVWSNLPMDWSPSYEFQFEGLLNFNPSFEGLVQIQDVKNIEMKCKTHIKLVCESYGTCFQYNVTK